MFKGLSVAKNYLRPESAHLRNDYSAKPIEDKCRQNQYFCERPYVHT